MNTPTQAPTIGKIGHSLPKVRTILLGEADHDKILVGYPTEDLFMNTAKQSYDAKVDSKKRITLRNAKYDYYQVTEMDDGSIVLSPRVLISLSDIPEETLAMIESSMKNYKEGKVSKPIKL